MLNFIVQQIYTFLNYIINIFPDGTGFPAEIHTAGETIGGYLNVLNEILPLDALKWCLLAVFGVEIIIFGFKTFKWVISHIPLIGGKGN